MFSFCVSQVYRNDDDLGFDPFTETQKALAEMIENEKQNCGYYYHNNNNNNNLLNNNNNTNGVYQKRFIAMQQNNRYLNYCQNCKLFTIISNFFRNVKFSAKVLNSMNKTAAKCSKNFLKSFLRSLKLF